MRWEWNKPVSVNKLSDLREAVGWNRMEKNTQVPCFHPILILRFMTGTN